MKIISVEGLDKAGKHSLSKALQVALREDGLQVERSEFHRYDTPIGDLIGKWLRGEFEADQITIELLMAADKQNQQAWFTELEERGVDVLILDRYTASQWAYSIAQDVDYCFAEALQRYMRPPDMTIFLDIPAEESLRRKGKHNGGVNDRYEADLHLQKGARSVYREYLGFNDICIDAQQSMETVAAEAIYYVRRRLAGMLQLTNS